jgi:hypothetical protein
MLSNGYKLRISEYKVLWRFLGHMRVKQQNKMDYITRSFTLFGMIKLRIMRYVTHVACMGKSGDTYKSFL